MSKILRRCLVLPVLAGALLTVGCISQEDFEKTQATANAAMSQAQQASQQAQQAGQAAVQAQQTADQARNEVASQGQKLDTMAQNTRGPRD